MNFLRLLYSFFKLGVLNELQYRANFAVQLFQSSLELGGALLGQYVMFSHTQTLGGWTPPELRALLGVYLIVGGAINMVVRPSMTRLMDDVRLGTLDFVLTKPEDSQTLVSIRQIEVWKAADIFLGINLLVVSLVQLGARTSPAQSLWFFLALCCGAATVYSFWLILATFTFWFVKMNNILVIFQEMYEAGKWPLGLYPPWLRSALTFIVPVAFAVTVPAEVLVGRLGPEAVGTAALLALAMLVLSRWFWKLGVRHYSGASA